jgi:tRNA threonylcarbamoyladenosine biosynthesis protein TsaE
MTKPSDRIYKSKIIHADRLEKTQAIAAQLAKLLHPGAIILLEGNLGSGKTAFVQALGKGLGIHTPITSPTFTLIDEYHCGRIPLYHIDLYRLEGKQINQLHLQEYWQGDDFPLGIVAIEWSNRLPVLPKHFIKIELTLQSNERFLAGCVPPQQFSEFRSEHNLDPNMEVDDIDLNLQSDREIVFTIANGHENENQYEPVWQYVNAL